MGKQWTPPSTDTPVATNQASIWTPPSTDELVKKKANSAPDTSTTTNTSDGSQQPVGGSPNIPGFEISNPLTNPSYNTSNFANNPLAESEQQKQNITDDFDNIAQQQLKKVNMMDTLHRYAATGSSNPATILSLAETAKNAVKPPESTPWEFVQNHVFIPAWKSIVGGADTAAAASVDFLSDLADKASNNDPGTSLLSQSIIHPVKNWFDKQAHDANNIAPVGATQGQDGLAGDILGDTIGAVGTVGTVALVPESAPEALFGASSAEVPALSNAALAGEKSVIARTALKTAMAPIVKLFAAQGAAEGYNASSTSGGDLSTNLLSAGEGAVNKSLEGIKLETQMAVGGSFGNKIANSLAEKGLLIGGKPTEALLNATMLGTVFGGTSLAGNITAGEPLDYNAALRQGVTGVVFGLPEVASDVVQQVKGNKDANTQIAKVGLMAKNIQDLNSQSIINNLMGFSLNDIHQINNNPETSDQLYAKSLEVGAQAYDEKNPAEKQKLQLQQLSIKNQADVKKATETIIKDPNGFLDGVFQSDLPVNDKVDLMNKATVINTNFNPVELHKQAINVQIGDLNQKIDLLDSQQSVIPDVQKTPQQKSEAFAVKDPLVQERTVLGLNLQDLNSEQNTGLAAQTAMKIIELKRQAELDKVGPLTHNVIENQNDGTHDVIANGDIVSQHATPEEAGQKAEDLNRPQIRTIDAINEKYNRQQKLFQEAIQRGLMEAPTGKTVDDAIIKQTNPEPEGTFKLNTPGGKISVEPLEGDKLKVTTDSGKSQIYPTEEAINAFEIKPEDIQKIAPEYDIHKESIRDNSERSIGVDGEETASAQIPTTDRDTAGTDTTEDIFPNSKIKRILYHGSDSQNIKFNPSENGIYFSEDKDYWPNKRYIHSVKIDARNPEYGNTSFIYKNPEGKDSMIWTKKDAIDFFKNDQEDATKEGKEKLNRLNKLKEVYEAVVFHPDQIHILNTEQRENYKLNQEGPISFTTAKGSTYEVHDDGSTTRDKAERSDVGHEGDSGPQERSQKTYYLPKEDAEKLAEIQATHPDKRVISERPDGRIGIQYLSGDDIGKFEQRTLVKPELEPKEGLIPLETWENGSKNHFGNEITEVNKDNTAPDSPTVETPNPKENGEIKTSGENNQRGKEDELVKPEAQEQTPEPVLTARGELLDAPLLKDTPYKLASAELPNGKFGVFETESGKLVSNLYNTKEELLDNFEKNKDKLTPEAIASKVAIKNITDNIRSAKIKGRAYESTLGLPVYAWNNTLELIARAIEGGAKLAEAIKLGVNHIKQNYAVKSKSDKDIEDAVRNAFLQKPIRNEDEEHHDYAKRILDWKKGLSSNEELSSSYKRELSKSAAPETRFNNQVKSGTELLRKNIQIPLDEFNKQLGIPEKDTEHYVAALKSLIDSDSIKKVNAEKIMQSLREKDPKKVLGTEASLLKRSLREREKAAGEGYRQAKAETKQAFLEYDAAKKAEFKDKIAETKKRYEEKLDQEKQARVDQKNKLTDTYNNIRSEIGNILDGLNKSKLLNGVDYSSRELLSFASHLNGVITENGIDRFKDKVSKLVDHADYSRDLNDTNSLIKQGKNLLNQNYVPDNIKGHLKDLVTLNPERIEHIKDLKSMLDDVVKSQKDGEVPKYTAQQLADYAQKQRDFDLQTRRSEILDKHQDISSQDEFQTLARNGNTNFVHKDTLADLSNKVINNDRTTHDEKVKELNHIDDTLDSYRKDMNNSIDENGKIVNTPQSFLDSLEQNKGVDDQEPTESKRDALENVAIAKQDFIDPSQEGLSPEQKQSLETLQKVPLKGQDAETLRQFNNVLENIMANDNHAGILPLEAKAIANSDQGAYKIVNYLKNTLYKTPKSVLADNLVSQKLVDARMHSASLNVKILRLINSDTDYGVALNTGSHFHDIQNDNTIVEKRNHELITDPLRKVFKENKDVARNPESAFKMTLFSYINQNRELGSDLQNDKEFQKRLNVVNKDIDLKTSPTASKREKLEGELEKKVWDGYAEKIKEKTGFDIRDKEHIKGLKYSDIQGIDFLNPGEKATWDVYRNGDQALQPDHQKLASGLNKSYEKWDNHMRDGYRFLNSGTTDVLGTDQLGFQATDNVYDTASDSLTQRVKGDPLAQKSGEKQKVLNMNFFNVQDQNIKNMLYDIHSLKDRMIFDEVMKNKDLVEAMGGVDNHQFYKEAVVSSVLNDMGLGKGLDEDGYRLVKSALNLTAAVGTHVRLLSISQYLKQYTSTIGNMIAYLHKGNPLESFEGKGLFRSKSLDAAVNKATGLEIPDYTQQDAVRSLLNKNNISRRGETLAGLNLLSNDQIAARNNILGSDHWTQKALVRAEDVIDKHIRKMNADGTAGMANMAGPIVRGDVRSAELTWIQAYSKYLQDKGLASNFKSIDWVKENENPNREAAAYAEHITAKQLNENTKAGRSKMLSSNDLGSMLLKTTVVPFGSFGIEKGQTMIEALRTLKGSLEKDKDGNFIYKDNAQEALKTLMANFTEEAFYRGIKRGITSVAPHALGYAFYYAIDKLFGDDKQWEADKAELDNAQERRMSDSFYKYQSDVIGNYIFNAMPNPAQFYSQDVISNLTKQLFGHKLFYSPPTSANAEFLQNSAAGGMFSAAFSGDIDRTRDLYRIIFNKNKNGVPVDITPHQKKVIGVDIVSTFLSLSGNNDADLASVIENARKQVDNQLGASDKFDDPYYADENAQKPLKIRDKRILLSDEHQDFYAQEKDRWEKKFISQGIEKKKASQYAHNRALDALQSKYGRDELIKQGTEIKPKK